MDSLTLDHIRKCYGPNTILDNLTYSFPLKEVSVILGTVSYTHLDVYKRQSLIPPIVFNQKTAALSSSCFFGLIGAPVHPYGEGIGKISVSGTRIDLSLIHI